MIKLYGFNDEVAKIIFTTFSDGSENCEIEITDRKGFFSSQCLTVSIKWFDVTKDIVRLLLVKDALDYILVNNGATDKKLRLMCGYMPQARADRRFNPQMAHPLKVFANLINNMNFDCVVLQDPHSDVTEGLVNNCLIVDKCAIAQNHKLFIEKKLGKNYAVCAPDAGATKDVFKVAQYLEKEFIQAMKVREVSTGNIVGTSVELPDEVPKAVLIVDDICDGGYTFIKLAELLKQKGVEKVGLLLSHGIFSKGKQCLKDGGIDYLFVNNELETFKQPF